MAIRLAATLLLVALALPGCGSDGATGTSTSAGEIPAPSGTLRIAVASSVEVVDPLHLSNDAERLASRQIYEPLISSQNGPFGQTRQRPGLVRGLTSRAGDTIWVAALRPGIRFSDGERLDAEAVRRNAERWMNTSLGSDLLPDLSAVDNPRPGLVRFIFDRAMPALRRRLSRPELGIVAPDALPPSSAGVANDDAPGTGPFELREQSGGRTLLARRSAWWGTPLGLGPGVDQLELIEVVGAGDRVEQLLDGSVEVAAGLDRAAVKEVQTDPLLTALKDGGSTIGLERSVRGLDTAVADQPLADVWLTQLR